MRLPRFTPVLLSSIGLVLFLVVSLWFLPLREPSMITPLGEYVLGNYPSGLALYQPSSDRYHGSTIFDDFVMVNGQSKNLNTLSRPHTSARQLRIVTVLASIANTFGLLQPWYTFSSQELAIETTVDPTSSTSATLTRTWQPRQAGISEGAFTITFHPEDIIIDPVTMQAWIPNGNEEDIVLLSEQIGHNLTAITIPSGQTWEIPGGRVLIFYPVGSGVIEFNSPVHSQVVVAPDSQTIQYPVYFPSTEKVLQQIGVKTWSSHTTYDWRRP